MLYAYLDESGDVGTSAGSSSYLVVGVLIGSERARRSLALHMKRMKTKVIRGKATVLQELKARNATHQEKVRMLRAIADEDVAIVAVIMNKGRLDQKKADPEDWHREAVGQAAWLCAQRWSDGFRLTIDKRHTTKELQDRLESAVRLRLEELRCAGLAIEQVDSRSDLCLQVVDYVAWALGHKQANGESQYYDLIKAKIVVEDIVEAS